MSKFILVGLIAFMATGCASMASMSGHVIQTAKIGGVPGDEKVHRISSGEVLYSEYNYFVSPSAKINEVNKSFNTVLGQSISVHYLLALTKMDSGELLYCGKSSVSGPGFVESGVYACFIDLDNNGEFEAVMYADSKMDLNEKAKYTKINEAATHQDGFKRELIFQGRTEKTVKFKYREFMNDMARPAFSQDIEYFIDKNGTTSGNFKGLQIDITSIEGNYIKYRVKGHIDQRGQSN